MAVADADREEAAENRRRRQAATIRDRLIQNRGIATETDLSGDRETPPSGTEGTDQVLAPPRLSMVAGSSSGLPIAPVALVPPVVPTAQVNMLQVSSNLGGRFGNDSG